MIARGMEEMRHRMDSSAITFKKELNRKPYQPHQQLEPNAFNYKIYKGDTNEREMSP